MIHRDVIYWGPLILLLTGMRPEEMLQLRKRNIVRRNGILAFQIAVELEQSGKTDDSVRLVPVPRALLELGFVEWWRERLQESGEMLFPEIATGELEARLSDVFGKRIRTIFRRLDLADAEEDIYALRKTFSSRLQSAGAPDSVRKAILGHKQRDILNRHYTQENLALLKEAVDSVDFGLRFEMDSRRGHPVLTGCALATSAPIDVELQLDETGAARWIRVSETADRGRAVLETAILPPPGWSDTNVDRDRPGMDALHAARRVASLTEGREVRLRNASAMRAAFEALCALADADGLRPGRANARAA